MADTLVIDSYKKLTEAFARYDAEAHRYKHHRFIPSWIAGIILGCVAAYLFALMVVGVDIEFKVLMHGIEFFAVFASYFLLTNVANRYYAKFLFLRRIAEILRNHIILADHGIGIPQKQVMYVTPAKSKRHRIAVAEQPFVITFLPFASQASLPVMAQSIRHKLLEVLEAQISHHQDLRITTFRKRKKYLTVIIACVRYAFLTVVAVKFVKALLLGLWHIELPGVGQTLDFYIILLPTLYAGLEGVKYFSDWQRNIDIAEQKIGDLTKLKEELLTTADDALPAWTARLEASLDAENVDWLERNVEKKLEPLI
jgi:hypothetical protein